RCRRCRGGPWPGRPAGLSPPRRWPRPTPDRRGRPRRHSPRGVLWAPAAPPPPPPPATPADGPEHLRPVGRLDGGPHQRDRAVAGLDIDPGLGVGERLPVHLGLAGQALEQLLRPG